MSQCCYFFPIANISFTMYLSGPYKTCNIVLLVSSLFTTHVMCVLCVSGRCTTVVEQQADCINPHREWLHTLNERIHWGMGHVDTGWCMIL